MSDLEISALEKTDFLTDPANIEDGSQILIYWL